MECELLQSPMISYRSLLYNTTVLYDNNYNNWGPINDLQVILQLPNNRAILSAYQLSTEMSSPSHLVTALDVNGFHQPSTPCIKGDSSFLSLQGAYAGLYSKGIATLF